jgi:hypothetical protein
MERQWHSPHGTYTLLTLRLHHKIEKKTIDGKNSNIIINIYKLHLECISISKKY